MEENIVGFDVKMADPSLVKILQGFSKLAIENTQKHMTTKHIKFLENWTLM